MYAENIVHNTPLFARVAGISENDTLNVRQKPDNHAKKIAKLPLNAYVGVNTCQRLKHAVWCKVHHMAQYDYEGYGWDVPDGWVNAKYLSFKNRGYVLIDKKANCDYAIGCEYTMCTLVTDYIQDKNYRITAIKTKKVARKRLRGESHFGAMTPEGDGYCTNGRMVNDYLAKQHR
jgi:hypothetical protein